jgi:Domain of unknown function (DUF5667)
MKDTLDTMLEQQRPHLTPEEQTLMLREIEARIYTPTPLIKSPYSQFIFSRSVMAICALVCVIAASGTVLAAEESRPGDLLFPIERAREEVRLALANDEEKEGLKAQFTTERFNELRDIIEEENMGSDGSRGTIDEEGELRVGVAVLILLEYIHSLEDEHEKNYILNNLNQELTLIKVQGRGDSNDQLRLEEAEIEIKDDRIEIKNDNSEIRIKDDGEIRIKHEDDDYKFESREDESDSENSENISINKFEVRVKDGVSEIRIEYGNNKLEYDTRLTTKDAIIRDVSNKTGISFTELSSALDIEFDD